MQVSDMCCDSTVGDVLKPSPASQRIGAIEDMSVISLHASSIDQQQHCTSRLPDKKSLSAFAGVQRPLHPQASGYLSFKKSFKHPDLEEGFEDPEFEDEWEKTRRFVKDMVDLLALTDCQQDNPSLRQPINTLQLKIGSTVSSLTRVNTALQRMLEEVSHLRLFEDPFVMELRSTTSAIEREITSLRTTAGALADNQESPMCRELEKTMETAASALEKQAHSIQSMATFAIHGPPFEQLNDCIRMKMRLSSAASALRELADATMKSAGTVNQDANLEQLAFEALKRYPSPLSLEATEAESLFSSQRLALDAQQQGNDDNVSTTSSMSQSHLKSKPRKGRKRRVAKNPRRSAAATAEIMYPIERLQECRISDTGAIEYLVQWRPSYVGLSGLSNSLFPLARDLATLTFGEEEWERQIKKAISSGGLEIDFGSII